MLNPWPLKVHLEPRTGNENGFIELILLSLCAEALIMPFFLHPSPTLEGTHTQLLLPPCLFKWITHIPCPFCGATTSFALLAHGRFLKALLANPWSPIFLFYIILLFAYLIAALIQKRSLRLEVHLSLTQGLMLTATIWSVKLLVWLGQTWWWTPSVFK